MTEILEDKTFDNKWTLWFHKVEDSDYSIKSYTKLCEIKTIKNLCEMINTIPTFNSGMFFFMKENIEPIWENKDNINGGMWTFKITKRRANKIWHNLMAALCGNSFTINLEDMNFINGISISPKISNCIIKVWNKDVRKSVAKKYLNSLEGLDLDAVYYRKNKK